jgi:hypothetical protein
VDRARGDKGFECQGGFVARYASEGELFGGMAFGPCLAHREGWRAVQVDTSDGGGKRVWLGFYMSGNVMESVFFAWGWGGEAPLKIENKV